MAAPKVKPLAQTVQKWQDRASGASSDYAQGAKASATEWEANTVASAGNYKASLGGNIEQRFSAGVRQAGSAKYSRGIDKGENRYSDGIRAGTQDYQSGMQEVLATIAATDLPMRKPRGDSGNNQRSVAIGQALNRARLAKLGAGR